MQTQSSKPSTERVQRFALLGILMGAVFVLLFTRLPGQISAMEKQRKYDGEFYEFAQLFSEVYSDIRERYVHEIDSKKLFEGAVRGMFAALDDPHSQWLSPDSLQQLEKETEGEFSGVGLHITLDQGVLTVIAPIPGSPAAKAGVLPWDRVTEIDGQTTENLTLLEAVKKLTGPQGSEVRIKVFREGEPELLDFTLRRDVIKVTSVFTKTMDDDPSVGYIRISRFADSTAEEVKAGIKELTDKHIKGIVIDLRYDSGGLLDKVIEICGFFLPKGQVIVSTKGRKEDNNREFINKNEPMTSVPMVVLVNRGSASASEIFAGAMQDTKRGAIIGPKGEKTFGKGSVQTITYLKHSLDRDDKGRLIPAGLRLTTALYYTPSGRTIHKIGITPDVEIEVTREQQRDLLRHGLFGDPDTSKLDHDKEKKSGEKQEDGAPADETKDGADKKPEEPFRDVLLDEAVKYLKNTLMNKNITKS